MVIAGVVLLIIANIVIGSFNEYWNKSLMITERKTKNEAVTECGKIAVSRWVDKNNGAEITEPYLPAFEKCMKDKGY